VKTGKLFQVVQDSHDAARQTQGQEAYDLERFRVTEPPSDKGVESDRIEWLAGVLRKDFIIP
jgi:hypothetical protein